MGDSVDILSSTDTDSITGSDDTPTQPCHDPPSSNVGMFLSCIECTDDGDQDNLTRYSQRPERGRSSRNGHTLKRYTGGYYGFRNASEPELRRNVHEKMIRKHGRIIEAPVTAVDAMITDMLVHQLDKSGHVIGWKDIAKVGDGPEDRWQTIQSLLETNAIHTTKEFSKGNDAVVTHYDVPITGHIIVPIQEVDENTRQRDRSRNNVKMQQLKIGWVQYRGRFYDPSIIYKYAGKVLLPLCPVNQSQSLQRVNAAPEYDEDTKKVKIIADEDDDCDYTFTAEESYHRYRRSLERGKLAPPANKNYLLQRCTFIDPNGDGQSIYSSSSANKKKSHHNKDYVEIDLHDVCDVTAIGLMGGYPKHTYPFPQYDRRIHHGKYYSVPVMREDTHLAWVKAFNIQYRDHRDGKWYPYERTFPGNNDVGTEVINKVTIRTRYLRLTAVEFERAKDMRVQVYGRSLRPIDESRKTIVDSGAVKQEATVRYSLYPAVERKYSMNHCKNYPCRCCYMPRDTNSRTRMLRSMDIKQQERNSRGLIEDTNGI